MRIGLGFRSEGPTNMDADTSDKNLDYLFDLRGYLVLKGAIGRDDLAEMNRWVDDH